MTIRSLDVGEGGDCFYHSVAAGLERLLLHSTAASRHVLRRIPLHIFSHDRRAVVQYLRNLCAEQILRWSPEELLDYFVNATFQQQQRTWQEHWNPTHMLESSGLSCILGCDTVRAVSDDPHGDIGDIILILDKSDTHSQGQSRQEHRVRVPQGHTFLNVLRQNLQDVFRTLGNTHWGDVTDARMLAEALDIGFCIFADRLQFNGTRCLVSLDGLRGDYAYFLAMWWDEPTHFRSLEIQCTQDDTFSTCWSTTELPRRIVEQYNVSNRTAPILSRANQSSGIV